MAHIDFKIDNFAEAEAEAEAIKSGVTKSVAQRYDTFTVLPAMHLFCVPAVQ